MSKTRVKQVEAIYTVVHYHDIPDDVYLLNQSENNADRNVYGSWWVKYGTLYYIDKELNIQEIEHDEDALAGQMKIPDTTITNETDDECDDKSVADLVCSMCGTESTNENQERFVAECNCCHRDFCEVCVELIKKNKDNKCNSCNNECETKCHDGCECECSDVESDDDEEEEENESDSDDE
jgi:hypothetical protein